MRTPDALFAELVEGSIIYTQEGRNFLLFEPSNEWIDAASQLGAEIADIEPEVEAQEDDDPREDDGEDCCGAADDDPDREFESRIPGSEEPVVY